MRTVGKTSLFCFSPPVMLATFIIELSLAIYVLWRYKLDRISRVAVSLLTLLALFQLAEYMVCGGLGLAADMWARLGYAAITMLPPVGVHMAYALANKFNRPLIFGLYGLATGFMAYFLLATHVFAGNQCVGNYVIFELGSTASLFYTIYYYGLLFLGIGISLRLAESATKPQRRALNAFIVGYVLFMAPTTIVNTIDPSTIAGIPSIMCGFAILFALVVVARVLPTAAKKVQKKT